MSGEDYAGELDCGFDGNWREFAGIAFTNLLLTVATLGLYRFWATTRVRRYLWSRTLFLGDRLEWTGTGRELFLGGIMALVVVLLPLAVANLVIRYLLTHGHNVAGQILSAGVLILFYVLAAIAIFRGLRYRLSRTSWRGIRGGSHARGIGYGGSYAWKYAIGLMPLGVLVPWAMVSLWNQRWNAMSFGPWTFEARGRVRRLWGPYLWCYVVPLITVVLVVLITLSGAVVTFFGIMPRTPLEWILIRVPAVLGFLFFFALSSLAYYASFFRQMVRSTTLGGLNFSFHAGAVEWMELYLVDILLVIATLGIGSIFLSYRHWTFYLRHLQIDGQLSVDAVTQSTTPAPRQGEGLLDAFDLGAL